MARPGGEAEGGARRALPHDRDRRRLLHGRRRRAAGRDLRPRRPPRRAGPGGRLARHRLHGTTGRGTPEHCGVDGPRRHPHHHLRQGARRRLGRLHRGAAGRSSTCCGSAAGPTSSRTRWRRWSRAPRCARWSCSAQTTELRDRLEAQHAALPRAHDRGRLRDPARRAPDRAHHVLALRARRRAARPALRARPARRGRST